MATVYAHALNGTLTVHNLARNEINSVDPASRLTPLGAAVWNGHIEQAQLLLENGAYPNGSVGSRPPLWVAASRRRNTGEMIKMLLDYNADANLKSEIDDNSTPLLRAVLTGQPSNVISFLVDSGASPEIENDQNESPESIAEDRNDLALQQALRPRSQRESSRLQALLVITGLMLFIVAWANRNAVIKATASVTGAACVIGAIKKRFNMSGVFGSVFRNERREREPEEEFKNSMRNYIQDTNLNRFFPPGDPFLENVVAKAVRLDHDPTNNLDVKDLTRLSLYQPVLYCDDSASMKVGSRKEHQRQFVQRIASITTQLVPDGDGIELRFINHQTTGPTLSNSNLPAIDGIMDRLAFNGSTPIGTSLRYNVLNSIIYEPVRNGMLRRPVLISIITDGEPEREPIDTLKNVMIECGNTLEEYGYGRNVVRFQLSQIGREAAAREFLSNLSSDPDLRDVLFCTAERLDDKFEELRDNERRLDQWLLKLLMGPIMDADQY